MISVEEARKRIADNCSFLDTVVMKTEMSAGYVLAEDLYSPIDLPGFRQSAMDGFAIRKSDLEKGSRHFELEKEIKAGRLEPTDIGEGKAARIFTGAVVPDNADIIIIQEKAKYSEKEVEVLEFSGKEKSHIRRVGEQIGKGELALQNGHLINAATVGFLASMGIQEVHVVRKPLIGIISTGNELRNPGDKLGNGEIYESNAVALKAALEADGFLITVTEKADDDLGQTTAIIKKALDKCDVTIVSGGISVGAYDYVKEALEKLGVKQVFYKVDQKPGKPMYFGMKGRKVVFALPGNPASLLTCYYIYVSGALKTMSGREGTVSPLFRKLSHDYHFKSPRPEFLKARYNGEEVRLLEGQGSFVLRTFALTNGLAYIHGHQRVLKKDSMIEIYPVPGT